MITSVKSYSIKSMSDVRKFFNYLTTTLSLDFYPEDDFKIYEDYDTHKKSFGTNASWRLNCMMKACKIVCKDNNVDINNLAKEYREKC